MTAPLLCAACLLLGVYLREKLRGCTLRAAYFKTALSLLFLSLGLWAWYRAGLRGPVGPIFPLVLLGLILGLLGDVWLDLKFVFPQADRAFTYGGFLCFGLGHLAYMAAMLLTWPPAGAGIPALVFLLGLGATLAVALLEKPMGLRYGRMKPVCLAYGFLLFSMCLLAGALALSRGWRVPALNLLFAGGLLFALSDLVLSGTYFGQGRDRPVDIILNYLSYYPAQFLIAGALLAL